MGVSPSEKVKLFNNSKKKVNNQLLFLLRLLTIKNKQINKTMEGNFTATEKRKSIHIAPRSGGDVFFTDLETFQTGLLLDLTKDIKNQEVRNVQMELLKKDKNLSLHGISKRLLRKALNEFLPHEL